MVTPCLAVKASWCACTSLADHLCFVSVSLCNTEDFPLKKNVNRNVGRESQVQVLNRNENSIIYLSILYLSSINNLSAIDLSVNYQSIIHQSISQSIYLSISRIRLKAIRVIFWQMISLFCLCLEILCKSEFIDNRLM